MLVQCPNCHTTYRVSESIVTTPKPTFRCSRCKNIFVVGPRARATPAREPSQPPAAPVQREEPRELSFSFPSPSADEAARENIAESASAPVGNGPAPEEKEPPFIIGTREDDWSIAPQSGAGEKTFTMKEEKSFGEMHKPAEQYFEFAHERPAAAKQDETALEATAEPAPDRRVSVTPYLLLCGALLFLFSSLTLLYKARPELIENSLKALPWIGSSVLTNDYLRQGIMLQTSRPRFQRIQGNREVFLLSGVAVNRNRVKVREVKIEGTIFGSDGKVIDRQIITVGNAISPKIIRDLTSQEISTLQKQSPVKRFEIFPDESAPFSIVFLKSSAEIRSFGYRVLSADEA